MDSTGGPIGMYRRGVLNSIGMVDRTDFGPYQKAVLRALLYSDINMRNKAIRSYERALQEEPGNTFAATGKANQLYKLCRYEEAAGCYNEVIKSDRTNPGALAGLAISLSHMGKDERAVDLCNRALGQKPGTPYLHTIKGVMLSKLGFHPEAGRCFDEALRRNPRSIYALDCKGDMLAGQGLHEEAITCYDAALGMDPDDAGALRGRAGSLGALGRYREMRECIERGQMPGLEIYDGIGRDAGSAWLGIDPDRPRVALGGTPNGYERYMVKASVLAMEERIEEALEYYDLALHERPGDPDALNDMGVVLGGMGRTEEALSCFERAAMARPGGRATLCNKGATLEELGRDEEALVCYDEAIAEDPERCMVRFSGGATGMAVSRMEFGRDEGPAMPHIYKGGLLARLGRHEEAVDACNTGLRASPGNLELLACMASSMAVLGRRGGVQAGAG